MIPPGDREPAGQALGRERVETAGHDLAPQGGRARVRGTSRLRCTRGRWWMRSRRSRLTVAIGPDRHVAVRITADPARPSGPGPTSYAVPSRSEPITQPARSGRCPRRLDRWLTRGREMRSDRHQNPPEEERFPPGRTLPQSRPARTLVLIFMLKLLSDGKACVVPPAPGIGASHLTLSMAVEDTRRGRSLTRGREIRSDRHQCPEPLERLPPPPQSRPARTLVLIFMLSSCLPGMLACSTTGARDSAPVTNAVDNTRRTRRGLRSIPRTGKSAPTRAGRPS
jgi:hypothetical protein